MIHILAQSHLLSDIDATKPSEILPMYSSILSSQQNSHNHIKSGFPAHSGQFSVRVFKAPTVTSGYGSSKYDSQASYRSAAPSDYYTSARSYDDPSSRFPLTSDSRRSSQYPTSVGTSSRDYSTPRAPKTTAQNSYNITRGNVQDTYVYERSDITSTSDFEDNTSNESYSPTSSVTSVDSLVAIKSPIESTPDRDGATSMRHHHPCPPILTPHSTGSTASRGFPQNREDVLRSSNATHFRNYSNTPPTTTPVPIPSSPPSTDLRALSSNSGSYATPSVAPPPHPPQSHSAPPPPVWHHAIPTVPPSETETEDVSLEARVNAEYNSISTAGLYNTGTNAIGHSSNPVPIIPAPVPPTRTERNSPPQVSRVGSNVSSQLHVKIPSSNIVPDVARDESSSSKVPTSLSQPSPASSTVVESLEEGRGVGYAHHRNSTVMIGERGHLLPPFDDRWINDQEGDQRAGPSYSRVTVPPSAPELRREYSNTNATYASSPTRASMLLSSSIEDQRLVPVPPIPIPIPTPGPRQRRDSRASHTVPPPRERKASDARDYPPPARSSPPRHEEPKLNTSPRRRAETNAGLPYSDSRTNAFPSSSATGSPPRSSEPYGASLLKPDHRTSPPIVAGTIHRSPGTASLENLHHSTYGPETSRSRYPPNGSSPEQRASTVPPAQGIYRPPPPTDNHRVQGGGLHRSQSTAPGASSSRRTPHGVPEPYRPQSTAPPESSYRSQYSPPTTNGKPPLSSSYQSTAQADNTRLPPPRSRTNSGSWPRTNLVAPPPSKTPSPPSRHAPVPVTRSNSRPNSPTFESAPLPPQRSQSILRETRERRPSTAYATPSPQGTSIQTTKDSTTTREQTGSPLSHSGSSTLSRDSGSTYSYPPREKRSSPKHRNVGEDPAKPVLTVRNPSPRSETSSDRTASPPHVQQSIPAPKQPTPPPAYTSTATPVSSTSRSHRRSTLPYHSRPGVTGHAGIDEYGHRITHAQTSGDPPRRRLSDGDQTDRPSFTFTGERRGGPTDRCVRWNENLICPSPVTPNRPKGWFNRKGDQLWTNDGAYRSPPPGSEYPMELDEYPEYGEGWMNEEGVRIDMSHRLIPKAPRRSALKQSKPL